MEGALLAEQTLTIWDDVRAARSAVDAAEVTLETARATAERTVIWRRAMSPPSPSWNRPSAT